MRLRVWGGQRYAQADDSNDDVPRTIRERLRLRHFTGEWAMSGRGAQAEQLAAEFLVRQGLRVVARNYRCRYGEIDLIMQDGDALVFVEVRLRSRSNFGGAAASIDSHKQRKLTLTAQHYLSQLSRTPPCRFDAVLLQSTGESVEWIKNAFSAW